MADSSEHLPKITAGVRQSMGWTVKGAVQAVKGGRLAELRAVFDAHVTERLRGLGLPVSTWSALLLIAIVTQIVIVTMQFVIRRATGRKLPPLVRGIPLVGGLLEFIRGPRKLLEKNYKAYGEVFTVPLLHKRMTFLIGPYAANHFFKATDEELSQSEVYGYCIPVFGKGVVYDVPPEERREQFRILGDALKSSKLDTYVPMMVQEAEDFFGSWGKEGVVQLKDELSELIIRTASRTLLGREVREHMFEEVKDLYNDLDAGMVPISVINPYLPIEPHRKRDVAREKMKDVFRKVIRARRENGAKENDMLQTLIDGSYKDGTKLTEDQITGMLIAGLFAGQHTSSVTSAWLGLFAYAEKERLLPALIKEQQEIMAKYGNELNVQVLSEMKVLHTYMMEALRINPPLILLLRMVKAPFMAKDSKGNEFYVPKGHIVATSPTFQGTLELLHKDPGTYDPTRWADPRLEQEQVQYAFIGFGGGRHRCMGENFAFLQVKAIWSYLLRNFDMELVDPFPEPDYEAMVIGPKPCRVKYTRRQLEVPGQQGTPKKR